MSKKQGENLLQKQFGGNRQFIGWLPFRRRKGVVFLILRMCAFQSERAGRARITWQGTPDIAFFKRLRPGQGRKKRDGNSRGLPAHP
jgi:hypothetical protein